MYNGNGGSLNVAEAENDIISGVIAYPNPAENMAYLNFQSSKPYKGILTVRDMSGRIMHSENVSIEHGDNQVQLDVANAASGIYLVSVGNAKPARLMVR